MTDNNTTPWNGIPDDPHESGWHWIGYPKRMEPHYWSSGQQCWLGYEHDNPPFQSPLIEYLGPATPPASRCRDGTKRVAVSAGFRREYDDVAIRMNDGTTYFMDGYYWHNDQPVFDVIGKTIPEMIAAAKRYRDSKQEGDDE